MEHSDARQLFCCHGHTPPIRASFIYNEDGRMYPSRVLYPVRLVVWDLFTGILYGTPFPNLFSFPSIIRRNIECPEKWMH